MNEPLLETVDVFLPGRGEELCQSPEYDWERIGLVEGHFFRNTKGSGEIRILLKAGSDEERKLIHGTENVDLQPDGLWFHDYRGMFGIHTPGMIVTSKGTVIATAIRRHDSMSDGGHEGDILTSRSEDDGKSWSRQECIFQEAGTLVYMGPVFEDRTTGTSFISYWKIPAKVRDDTGFFKDYAAAGGGFYLLKSTDEGKTWSEPVLINPAKNDAGWMAWNNNSVHGIQLAGGACADRLVIPAFFFKAGEPGYVEGIRGGLLLSDDHGETWRAGAVLKEGSDEVSLVQTGDDELYITHRMNSLATGKRHYARSTDGGETLSEEGEHADLACRGLHVGLVGYGGGKEGASKLLLFSNPPSFYMAISSSRDAGATWSEPKLLHDTGKARYSDLAVTDDGTILCLFTNGAVRDSEKISVARFNRDWLES